MSVKTLLSSFFFGLSIMYILSVNAFTQTTVRRESRSSTYLSGSYAYKLTDQDFVNTPAWNLNEGEPPISVGRAIKITNENLPRFVKSGETWRILGITLQNFSEGKWYYRIHSYCYGTVCREIEERSFTAIVKMDGTFVEPKKVTIEN